MVETVILGGAGGERSPWLSAAAWGAAGGGPGPGRGPSCCWGSMVIRCILVSTSSSAPGLGVAPPASPLPAPLVTTGWPDWAAWRNRSLTSAVLVGKTAAAGVPLATAIEASLL